MKATGKFLPLFVALVAGCGLLRGERVHAPLVERPPESAWPFALPPLEEKAPREGTPLTLQAFLLSARPARWRRLGVDLERDYLVLDPKDFSAVSDALLRGRRASPLTAPRLVVRPGSPARASMVTTRIYLGDYDLGQAPGHERFNPVARKVYDGVVVDLEARSEGSVVVVTSLQARMATGLGMRDCQSWADLGTAMASLLWQEPVVLAATASLPRGAEPRLLPGYALVLPLRQALVVAKASVRAKVEYPVEVRNERSLRFLVKAGERGYPLEEQLAIILTPALPATRPR